MTTRARVRRGAFEQKVMAALPSWIVVEYAAQYLLAFGKTTSGSRQMSAFDELPADEPCPQATAWRRRE